MTSSSPLQAAGLSNGVKRDGRKGVLQSEIQDDMIKLYEIILFACFVFPTNVGRPVCGRQVIAG